MSRVAGNGGPWGGILTPPPTPWVEDSLPRIAAVGYHTPAPNSNT